MLSRKLSSPRRHCSQRKLDHSRHYNHLILELQHMEYNIGATRHDVVISYLEALGFENHGMFCSSELGVDGDYYFSRK